MSALTALLVFLISFALVAVLFRMPVSFALGTSSLLVLAYAGFQLVTVPQFAFSGLDSFALLAIPFYIFAGVIMEYSGISKMLIDWVKSFVGRVRGATGIITTCACMAFGVLTGSAMATISAIGKMMVPELEKEGYPHGYSSALLAATCFLGILIPPSVPGIMYALASGAKITPVWMSTIGPAFIFAIGYFIINYFRIGRHQARPEKVEFHPTAKLLEIGKSTIYAIPALLMPIIIYGCIYGGLCTVTEAGAVSCVYGILYFFVLKIIDKKKIQITFWRCCAIAGASTARDRSAERLLCCRRQSNDFGGHFQLSLQPDYRKYQQPRWFSFDDQCHLPVHGNLYGYQCHHPDYDPSSAASGTDLWN